MTINNFSELLSNALKDKDNALLQWTEYQAKNLFTAKQIDEACEALCFVIMQPYHPHRGNALYLLALIHFRKLEVPEGIVFLDEAIKFHNKYATNLRGKLHERGIGGSPNYPEAIRLYDKAITLGSIFAIANRAYMHENGLGCQVDYQKAAYLYEQGLALGDAIAANNRALMHEKGHGGAINYSEAVRLFKQAIAAGVHEATHNLNSMEKKFAAVRMQQQTVNGLISQLQGVVDILQRKADENPYRYCLVLDKVRTLKTTLSEQSELFFNSPTKKQLEHFRTSCGTALVQAENESKNHRGIWGQLHPIIKGIIGVCASLTVIPAMLAAVASKDGYLNTFFSTPKTVTQQHLEEVTNHFNRIETALYFTLPIPT